jgi:hypothetical protein
MLAGRTAITFRQYLCRRGYNYMTTGEVMLRMIRKSFSERSFCRFWRMWNPLTGYLFFLLYSFLSGNRKRPYLIFVVFITSGVVLHDLVLLLITGSPSVIYTVTFALYSIIFFTEEMMSARRKKRGRSLTRLRKIPIPYFVAMNMILLGVPWFLGIVVNYYIFPGSPINNLFR